MLEEASILGNFLEFFTTVELVVYQNTEEMPVESQNRIRFEPEDTVATSEETSTIYVPGIGNRKNN